MVKFICNICRREIHLQSDADPDMITITTTGKEWCRVGRENKLRHSKRTVHVHHGSCYSKFLSLFNSEKVIGVMK